MRRIVGIVPARPSYSIAVETIKYEFHRKSAKLQNKLLQ